MASAIPDDFWRHVPCGHPPDPVARWQEKSFVGIRNYVLLCHCGRVLDPQHTLPIEPVGAPGPIVGCDNCGCAVAVPVRS